MSDLEGHTFGRRLKAAREELGLSQERLAEAIGVVRRTLAHYEAGTKSPEFSKLPAIAAATGKPLAWFFQDAAEPAPAAQPPPQPDMPSLLAQLVAAQVRQALSLSGALALDEGADPGHAALFADPSGEFRRDADAERHSLAAPTIDAGDAPAVRLVGVDAAGHVYMVADQQIICKQTVDSLLAACYNIDVGRAGQAADDQEEMK